MVNKGLSDIELPHASNDEDVVHKGIVLHFMVQLCLGKDADSSLPNKKMGRVHHRILYFSYFSPGITVGELLEVLSVRHQNIQSSLKFLLEEGYIVSLSSEHDGRVKNLYCTKKGKEVLNSISSKQRERFQEAYKTVTLEDIESYFKVMYALLDFDRRSWVKKLTNKKIPLSQT